MSNLLLAASPPLTFLIHPDALFRVGILFLPLTAQGDLGLLWTQVLKRDGGADFKSLFPRSILHSGLRDWTSNGFGNKKFVFKPVTTC